MKEVVFYMFRLQINSVFFLVFKKFTILRVLERLNIEVPKFCYHERLNIAGNCRMCIIEIEKILKPVISCATDIYDGLVVWTDSPFVKKSRESVLEFLLLNHPLDCPICDQGGECDLQEQSLRYGSDFNRAVNYKKRAVEDKKFGPLVKTIMTRCIHCTRCVRFNEEVTLEYSLGTLGRGKSTEIGFYLTNILNSELSGNVVDLCPVGALTSSAHAINFRKWELVSYVQPDVSSNYLVKVNVSFLKNTVKNDQSLSKFLDSEDNNLLRILPASNIEKGSDWISDYSRYNFNVWKDNIKTNFKINNFFFKMNQNFFNKLFNKNLLFFFNKFSFNKTLI